MKKIFNIFVIFILLFSFLTFNAKATLLNNVMSKVNEIVTENQLKYELGENSPYKGQNITYGLDSDGNIIRLSVIDYTTGQIITTQPNSVTAATTAVFVGGLFVGYIYSSLIEGVVISATGSSGGEWVARAISFLLGNAHQSTLYLSALVNCDIYPPHSYQYYQCKRGQ